MKTGISAEMMIGNDVGPIDPSMVRSFIEQMSDDANDGVFMQVDVFGPHGTVSIVKEENRLPRIVAKGYTYVLGRKYIGGTHWANGRKGQCKTYSC